MDQSAIRKSREAGARWRAARRLVWVAPAALGGLVLGLQQAEVWTDPPSWLVWLAVISGSASIITEATIGVFRKEDRAGGPYGSGDRQKFMSSCAVEIHQQMQIPVAALGVSVWVVHTPRRSLGALLQRHERLHYLWRIERFRASDPPATGDAWSQARGVIGACIRSGEPMYRDYRALQERFPKESGEPSNAAWKDLCKAGRNDGFERHEFVKMINRYEQVYAYPITDGDGHVVGCVSLDVTSPSDDEPGATHRSIHTKSVISIIDRLARSMGPTAEKLAVRP